MATEKEQAAMDYFNQIASDDPEWQRKRKLVADQMERDKRRFGEMIDGEVKARALLEKLRTRTKKPEEHHR